MNVPTQGPGGIHSKGQHTVFMSSLQMTPREACLDIKFFPHLLRGSNQVPLALELDNINAPVICIPGSLGAGDSGDIAGPKCRDLTFDESRQCRRCTGVLISRQNTILCHILTTSGKLSVYICSLISSCFVG